MNYQRIYDDFIADRRAREAELVASGVYFERHHITPRSMEGGDEAENIIALTAGDHFFAHLCLAKIHGGWQWRSVWTMADMAAPFHKRSELFGRRRWVNIAREKTRPLKAENARRLHQDPEWLAIVHGDDANTKRSETLRVHFASEAGMAHKRSRLTAALSKEAIAKRAETTRQQYASGARDADKLRMAEQAKRQATDPEWLATLHRGDDHPRRKNPEKWAKAERAFKENNPMKDPSIRAKMIATQKAMWANGRGKGACKEIRCLETGAVFRSCVDAARELGISASSLGKHLRGVRPHVNNLHFEFTS